ncbi:hypothetical protein J4E86_006601 [Alternaria arbusti]|uniref:uncharacterized protein n=1 Tax=Alternaria arbusti TaxID=232088 RepID=UPI00222120C8|nr:uncharacterized protein J4E86_006601 [Alternaria arbusti]KAI4953062.1 hypothetical protein J4E86_006601 [Alternaria arbusti]
MATSSPHAHVAMMKDLRTSGKYSDFTITCGGDTHHVHKNIVCCRSGFFERAERFPAGREAAESKVDLPEDDPAIVKLLIQFLYENDYETKDLTIKSDTRAAKALHKYDVNGLKDLARTNFSALCAIFWDKDVFAQAAEHALSSTPDSDDGLREVIRQIIISHIELLNKSDIAELLSKHTDFVFSVLRRVAEEKAGLKPKAKTTS